MSVIRGRKKISRLAHTPYASYAIEITYSCVSTCGDFSHRPLVWSANCDVYSRHLSFLIGRSFIPPPPPRKMRIVYQLCTGWQDFDWLEASRGPSALAELLVNTITTVLVRDNSEKLQVDYIDWLRVCHLVLSCLDGRDVPVCPSHLSHPVVPVVRPRPVVHAIHLQHTAQTRVTARPRLVLEENCHTGRCQYCCIWKNSGLDVWWTEMITANNEAIAHFITALNQDFRF